MSIVQLIKDIHFRLGGYQLDFEELIFFFYLWALNFIFFVKIIEIDETTNM